MLHLRNQLFFFALVSILLSASANAQLISGSTNQWKPILFGGKNVSDPSLDQQTGQRESDLVGSSTIPSAYMAFDPATSSSLTDGTLYFRIRVAEDSQAAGYSGYVWVGIDANSDGKLDLFAGVNRQGSSAFNVLRNPGTNTNTSPSTTSIVTTDLSPSPYAHTASNYNWAAVGAANYTGTNFDADGGAKADYFMSFGMPFQDIVNTLNTTGSGRPSAISINQNTNLRFVVATSQQGNLINQDYNGGNFSASSSSTFTSLGAFADTTKLASVAIPEPESLWFVIIGAGCLIAFCCRKSNCLPTDSDVIPLKDEGEVIIVSYRCD